MLFVKRWRRLKIVVLLPEELRTLLGRGRAKKGIFEGDLEEGELEIGQVSAQYPVDSRWQR